MTNIAEILKDYPKGTKLYSPICGECELECVDIEDIYPIVVTYGKSTSNYKAIGEVSFTKYGQYLASATKGECLLWSSKDNHDWESMSKKSAFKPGDIVITACNDIAILDRPYEYSLDADDKWWYVVVCANQTCGGLNRNIYGHPVRLANLDEIAGLFQKLAKRGLCYNSTTHVLEEIKKEHTFQPYEKVLVRDSDNGTWKADFFSHKVDGLVCPYKTTSSSWIQCIPYQGNEHLVGTTNNPTE